MGRLGGSGLVHKASTLWSIIAQMRVKRKAGRIPVALLIVGVALALFLLGRAISFAQTAIGEHQLAQVSQKVHFPAQPIYKHYYYVCSSTSAAFAPGPTTCQKNYELIFNNSANQCTDYQKVNAAILAANYSQGDWKGLYEESKYANMYGQDPSPCQYLDYVTHTFIADIQYYSAAVNPRVFVVCKFGVAYDKYDLDKNWPGQNKLKFDRSAIYGCVFTE